MRRLATSVVVLGLAVLAVLAAADAFRGREDAVVQPTTVHPLGRPTLFDTLRRESVGGTLVYSDLRCRLHSLVLHGLLDELVLSERTGRAVPRCRFSDAGGRFTGPGVVESPGGGEVASCSRGLIRVRDSLSWKVLQTIRGCSPAWHPDGRLTYARGEAVLEDGRVLYRRAELHRIARRHPNVAGLGRGVPFRVDVLALAWLDRVRLAMSLEVRIEGVEAQNFVVLLDGDRLLALIPSFRRSFRNLVVSPTGSFLAEDEGTVVTKTGHVYSLPDEVPRPHSIAFSPDEGWLALATPNSIFLVGTPRNLGRIIRLPVAARHLIWEPGGFIGTSRVG